MGSATQVRVLQLCTVVATLCCLCAGFSPNNCRDGVYQSFDSNGFEILVDATTWSLLSTTSSEIGGQTYRQALDSATSRARDLLANISSGDAPYDLTMRGVPFRIESTNGEHFFYTGECGGGCVVTQLPARLIRDIYNNPTLFLHEYAHVYQNSILQSAASLAVDDAYSNWKDNVFPSLHTSTYSGQPFDENTYGGWYWYAWANKNEYFAVTTEGFTSFDPSSPINKWPPSRTAFENDDPTGFAAVRTLWALDAQTIRTESEQCSSSPRRAPGFTSCWMALLLLVCSISDHLIV